MERIEITILTGNAAFGDEPATEIARILHKLADEFADVGIPSESLMDINGNQVGSVQID